jgi:hypothetical protein
MVDTRPRDYYGPVEKTYRPLYAFTCLEQTILRKSLPARCVAAPCPPVMLRIGAKELPDIRGEALAFLQRHLPVLPQVFSGESNIDHHNVAHRLENGYLAGFLLLIVSLFNADVKI